MILHKYFAALVSITIVLFTALLAIPSGAINGAAIVQLVSVGVAAIATYLAPLADIRWKGIIKTGVAIVAAVIAVLYPIVQEHGHPTGTQYALMVLAGLNALGVEIGVNMRTEATTTAVVTVPPVDTTPIASVNDDPEAAKAADAQLAEQTETPDALRTVPVETAKQSLTLIENGVTHTFVES